MIGRLLPPVAVLFLTGLADDWLDLRPWQKLLGQLVAAVWAWSAGVRIAGVAGHPIAPWLGFLVTVGWLILCSNAFNLIDGIDGLAAGVGLTATLTTLVAGLLNGDHTLALATAPLAGCLLGFLRYNFNPASIFLGDSGSLLIGFLLGVYSVIWSQKSVTLLGVVAPALAVALPLLEVGLSILRRFLGDKPILSGDRGHIHHRLLDRGFSTRHAALLLYGAGALGAAAALAQGLMHNAYSAIAAVMFGGTLCLGVCYLRYAEFTATARFFWAGLRPMLGAHVKLELLERSLLSATSIEECWQALEHAARSLGYSSMTARFGDVRFVMAAAGTDSRSRWQMRLNLSDDSYVNLNQLEGSDAQPILVIPFADIIRRLLPEKLRQIRAGHAGGSHPQAAIPNSRTTTVISSDCVAPPVKVATAS
jgi:UDP-GlcNAc:undecaprenyl-phosphate GlcNAc-1-phosphate transferase